MVTTSSPEELEVIRYTAAWKDFLKAQKHFQLAEKETDEDKKEGLIEAGIAAYVRPFTQSRIAQGDKRRPLLTKNDVPTEHHALHDLLMNYRHQFVAHTDIEAQNITVEKPLDANSAVMSWRGEPMNCPAEDMIEVNKLLTKLANKTGNLALDITSTSRQEKKVPLGDFEALISFDITVTREDGMTREERARRLFGFGTKK